MTIDTRLKAPTDKNGHRIIVYHEIWKYIQPYCVYLLEDGMARVYYEDDIDIPVQE